MTKTAVPARETALSILLQVAKEGAYVNIELSKALANSGLSPQDRGLVTELVYGTLRQQGRIDYILSRFLKKPLTDLPLPILLILRLAVYQVFHMDRIPERAAVNEAVNLAKKYGHPGTVKLVNGVLRSLLRGREEIVFPSLASEPGAHIAAVHSHPRWLVDKWLRELGERETINLCAADNQPRPLSLRVNSLKTDRQSLIDRLAAEGLQAEPGRYDPLSLTLAASSGFAQLAAFREGLFQVQDEGSMLAAMALMASPDEKILDVCAAPGGKATYLAQAMANRGEIRAFDIYPHKLDLIRENCRRLGITIVQTQAGDARDLPGVPDGWADGVLVDAPCSGLGVLCRRPDARWQKKMTDIPELSALQREIISSASRKVRPGGRLVYATCTISPAENQELVGWFLGQNPDFQLDEIASFRSLPLGEADQAQARQGMIQLLPHRHGTDGMFIARMRRKGGEQ